MSQNGVHVLMCCLETIHSLVCVSVEIFYGVDFMLFTAARILRFTEIMAVIKSELI